MYESEKAWRDVDAYFVETLVPEDDALRQARQSGRHTTMPKAEVAANQGKLLALLCRIAGAERVLEFGTLAGYSTIWLARAVGEGGHVTTLELEPGNAAIAAQNLQRAGVADRVAIITGSAAESAERLIADGAQPYDFVFIDADKPNNANYLAAAVQLTHRGSVIVVDNVIRQGEILDASSADERVHGSRAVLELLGSDRRLDATAVQTVGLKGWDGFAIGLVR